MSGERREPSSAGGEEDAPASSVLTENPGAPVEEGAPVGPTDGEEAAFLAEQREQGFGAPTPAKRPVATTEVEEKGPLPPLDDLVQRIPPATRELMDELFRAKFVTVKRVPASALKG